jgi:hypothetical protein
MSTHRSFGLNQRLCGAWLALLLGLSAAGCAPSVQHRAFTEEQVGLAALQEEPLKQTLYGPEIQGYVARYPIFAETVNQELARDLRGYLEKYNTVGVEPLRFMTTDLSEIDGYALRAAKAVATVRVTLRLLNYIGLKLVDTQEPPERLLRAQEVAHTTVAEAFSGEVARLREATGTLSRERRVALAKDVIAMSVGLNNVREVLSQCDPLVLEGENLLASIRSAAYKAELQKRDAGRAKLLPEIESNLTGLLGGLKRAKADGASLVRNGALWKLAIVNAID